MRLFTLAAALLTLPAVTATAQPGDDPELQPPSSVAAAPEVPTNPNGTPRRPLRVARPWGGGIRLTGLSGIGALPGVNYGGELAGQLSHDEYFAELAFGWWKPEKTYTITSMNKPIELGLDVWTLRGGWASVQMPLRAWVLAEVGELATAQQMPGVVTRMVMGDVPQERRWQAVGAGFGVAWPMGDNARLFGMIELAVPVHRDTVMLDSGPYQPDALVARSSAGLELGWF